MRLPAYILVCYFFLAFGKIGCIIKSVFANKFYVATALPFSFQHLNVRPIWSYQMLVASNGVESDIRRGLAKTTLAGLAKFTSTLLGIWLLYAAVPHILNPYLFLATIHSYELIHTDTAAWVAAVLPFIQLIIGICLIAGLFEFGCHLITTALFVVFFLAQTHLRFIIGISNCGCFGPATDAPSFLDEYSYYLVITAVICSSIRTLRMSRYGSY